MREKRGVVLIIVLIVFLVFSVLSISLIFLSSDQLKNMQETEYDTRAHYLAYSGIEIARKYLDEYENPIIIHGELTESSTNSIFSITPASSMANSLPLMREDIESRIASFTDSNVITGIYKGSDGIIKIISYGIVGNISKSLVYNMGNTGGSSSVNLDADKFPNLFPLFDHALFVENYLSINKKNLTIVGPIGSNSNANGSIYSKLENGVESISFVSIGPDTTESDAIDYDEKAQHFNEVRNLPEQRNLSMEEYAYFFDNNFDSIGSIESLTGNYDLGNKITDVTFVKAKNLDGTLTLSGSGFLIAEITDEIKDGSYNFKGNVDQLIVYYSGNEEIKFSSGNFTGMLIVKNDVNITLSTNSSGEFRGLFYSPNSEVYFSGNGNIIGSLIADKMYLAPASAEVHYVDYYDDFIGHFIINGTGTSLFSFALFANNEINFNGTYTINGNVGVNSNTKEKINFDSSGGANVNGTFYIGPNATTTIGDYTTGFLIPSNAVITRPSKYVQGWLPERKVNNLINTVNMPTPVIPAQIDYYPDNGTYITNGNFTTNIWIESLTYEITQDGRFNSITVGSGMNRVMKIYTNDDLRIIIVDNLNIGYGTIEIVGTGSVVFYVTGTLSVSSGAKTGSGNMLMIYTGTNDVTINGGSSIETQGIYAPNATVNIGNGSSVSGPVYAENINISGNSFIDYPSDSENPFLGIYDPGLTIINNGESEPIWSR